MNVARPALRSVARVHAALRALPLCNLDAKTGGDPILVLAPHPDDETLGCGGLIAQAVATGQSVEVLVLTDGSMSHPNSTTHPKARLQRVREAESRDAARSLGLTADHVHFLGLRDARAPHAGEAARRAAQAIADHATRIGARTLFVTWRHDPHGDHKAASVLAGMAAAMTGAQVFEYPVWGWTLPPRRLLPVEDVTGFRLDIGRHSAAKARAIACHRTQLGQVVVDDPSGFAMEQHFVALFSGRYETFVKVTSAT